MFLRRKLSAALAAGPNSQRTPPRQRPFDGSIAVLDCTTSIAEWKGIGLHVMIPIIATSVGVAPHGGDAVGYSFDVVRFMWSGFCVQLRPRRSTSGWISTARHRCSESAAYDGWRSIVE